MNATLVPPATESRRPAQDPEPDYYLTHFNVPRGTLGTHSQEFYSPTFEDAISGVGSIVLQLLQEFAGSQIVDLRIYHVRGTSKEKHLVSRVTVENRPNFHPAANGPKDRIRAEEPTLI